METYIHKEPRSFYIQAILHIRITALIERAFMCRWPFEHGRQIIYNVIRIFLYIIILYSHNFLFIWSHRIVPIPIFFRGYYFITLKTDYVEIVSVKVKKFHFLYRINSCKLYLKNLSQLLSNN